MGIAKEQGEDNDCDAAILAARNEGVTDGQIQALPDAERGQFNRGASATGQDGRPSVRL